MRKRQCWWSFLGLLTASVKQVIELPSQRLAVQFVYCVVFVVPLKKFPNRARLLVPYSFNPGACNFTRAAPTVAPRNWTNMYNTAWIGWQTPMIVRPKVTAGLMWPPLVWAVAYTREVIQNPNASAVMRCAAGLLANVKLDLHCIVGEQHKFHNNKLSGIANIILILKEEKLCKHQLICYFRLYSASSIYNIILISGLFHPAYFKWRTLQFQRRHKRREPWPQILRSRLSRS